MSHTKDDSVKGTGCDAGAFLAGHDNVNRGLLIRVHASQPAEGGFFDGPFDLIEVGGHHAFELREFEGQTIDRGKGKKSAKWLSDQVKGKMGKEPSKRGMAFIERGMLRVASSEEADRAKRLFEERLARADKPSEVAGVQRPHALSAEAEQPIIAESITAEVPDAIDDIEAHRAEYEGETERDAIVKSRIGQGRYREEMIRLWGGCAVTGIANPALLRASHAQPWRDCTNEERLDPHNGLLLIPNLDHLFDRQLIGFDEDGHIRISSALSDSEQKKLGVNDGMRLRKIIPKTRAYLAYHLRFIR